MLRTSLVVGGSYFADDRANGGNGESGTYRDLDFTIQASEGSSSGGYGSAFHTYSESTLTGSALRGTSRQAAGSNVVWTLARFLPDDCLRQPPKLPSTIARVVNHSDGARCD